MEENKGRRAWRIHEPIVRNLEKIRKILATSIRTKVICAFEKCSINTDENTPSSNTLVFQIDDLAYGDARDILAGTIPRLTEFISQKLTNSTSVCFLQTIKFVLFWIDWYYHPAMGYEDSIKTILETMKERIGSCINPQPSRNDLTLINILLEINVMLDTISTSPSQKNNYEIFTNLYDALIGGFNKQRQNIEQKTFEVNISHVKAFVIAYTKAKKKMFIPFRLMFNLTIEVLRMALMDKVIPINENSYKCLQPLFTYFLLKKYQKGVFGANAFTLIGYLEMKATEWLRTAKRTFHADQLFALQKQKEKRDEDTISSINQEDNNYTSNKELFTCEMCKDFIVSPFRSLKCQHYKCFDVDCLTTQQNKQLDLSLEIRCPVLGCKESFSRKDMYFDKRYQEDIQTFLKTYKEDTDESEEGEEGEESEGNETFDDSTTSNSTSSTDPFIYMEDSQPILNEESLNSYDFDFESIPSEVMPLLSFELAPSPPPPFFCLDQFVYE